MTEASGPAPDPGAVPPLPDSPVAALAFEAARTFSSQALMNHGVRSYLWAAAYGAGHGIEFDAELLYVAAVLHDIALTPSFDNHRLPFEVAGGHVAWMFGAGAGWPPARRDHVARTIVDHMRDDVTIEENTEGYLLAVATGLDISGRSAQSWPDELKTAVLAQYPRLDLASEFVRCFADQAARKPGSSAATAIASGIAGRIAGNPLDSP
ncbi:MAG TPA: HD domain-containing protein [Jatrophihabitans sp.]|nr:HD domain-containing protein [Jatrophihabitans sp.]